MELTKRDAWDLRERERTWWDNMRDLLTPPGGREKIWPQKSRGSGKTADATGQEC